MTNRRLIFTVALVFLVSGCASIYIADQIHPGMTQDDVKALLGKPRSKQFDETTESWLYKDQQHNLDYYMVPARYYWIVFQDGKVIALQDAGQSRKPSSGGSGGGMNILCRDAIARGDQGAMMVHCK